MNKGRVTIPSESNFLEKTKELMELWGADAIRDSDGTKLDEDLKKIGAKTYSTYFVARGHNDFIEKHPEEIQQIYLQSNRNLATSRELKIHLLDGILDEQIQPNYRDNPKKYWEVRNRTAGTIIPVEQWEVCQKDNSVTLKGINPYEEYTVSFLAYMIWDPTQMYNHITNDWGSKPHDIPFDVRQDHANRYMQEYLMNWLAENPEIDVVRFTTFFYHFTLVFNELKKEKFVDWFGYGTSVSVKALEAFEKEYGYSLTPEDFIDEGFYNSPFRVPTKEYRDYIDFIQKFTAKEAKKLVDLVHAANKEAMMFLGDNWIGLEPYGKYFGEVGLDAVVGSVGNGTTLRMLSEIPSVSYTEGRFLPYFFPDVFKEGGNPTKEAQENWLSARRAIMRKPVDRIGYGGYLSLAAEFPDFVSYIQHVTDEFRDIYGKIKDVKPYSGLKVGILNSWGKLRSWQSHMVAHAIWYQQTYSYAGVLEALSGQNVEVEFLNFDEIKNGVPEDIDVLMNIGDAGTAYSGGANWQNPNLIAIIQAWVAKGGGFIGIGEPSAILQNGRYFQLASLLGVEKELGFSLSEDKYFYEIENQSFITDGIETFDFGEGQKNIYALNKETKLLAYSGGSVQLATHDFGAGRGVYISGLPYSQSNAHLLHKALYFAAHKENEIYQWYSDNASVEVHAYPAIKKYAVVNNTTLPQKAKIYRRETEFEEISLASGEMIWRDFHE